MQPQTPLSTSPRAVLGGGQRAEVSSDGRGAPVGRIIMQRLLNSLGVELWNCRKAWSRSELRRVPW